MDATKHAIARRIGCVERQLVDLSHRIHAHPELGFEEYQASSWVAEILGDAGFHVQHGCYGLPTAVRATIGSGPVHVGICAEYDALPDIGHACGHNIIAAAGVGAALGLAGFVDELGLTVTLLGTPAEEGGGGKILMLERGAFDGLDAAMMVHPAGVELAAMPGTAVSQFEVAFEGKPAHAGAYPELGVNAADAMTIAQVAVGQLRQQTRTTDRIQGIVTAAGSAVNVIPDHSAGKWIVRSDTAQALAILTGRVQRCFEAGALASGCTLSIVPTGPDYADLRPDAGLLALYRANAQALGRHFPDVPNGLMGAATDMGNVSHVVPTIHPMLGLDCHPAANHQPEFTAACITPTADRAVIDGATAMAWTAADFTVAKSA
nr:M20 family metallopeptidase [Rhodococcus sp. (in: high G+C Gram-positive bacteria)]